MLMVILSIVFLHLVLCRGGFGGAGSVFPILLVVMEWWWTGRCALGGEKYMEVATGNGGDQIMVTFRSGDVV